LKFDFIYGEAVINRSGIVLGERGYGEYRLSYFSALSLLIKLVKFDF